MNSTFEKIVSTPNHGFEYSTYILGTMFIISEVLPLLKGKQNGLLHTILCLIRGSKCVLEKGEKVVQKAIEEKANDKV
jgi:hypothetical protein